MGLRVRSDQLTKRWAEVCPWGGCILSSNLWWDSGEFSGVSFFFSSSIQLLSHVQLFATPWTTAFQASLSITDSQSLLKLMCICQWRHPTISSSVSPFYSRLQPFPASGSFQMSQFFTSGGQSIGTPASASVLQVNIQDWFPLGWTHWISLLSRGFSRVFSNTTVQKHQFFRTQLSL